MAAVCCLWSSLASPYYFVTISTTTDQTNDSTLSTSFALGLFTLCSNTCLPYSAVTPDIVKATQALSILAAIFCLRLSVIAVHDCCGRNPLVPRSVYLPELALLSLTSTAAISSLLWPLLAPQLFPQPAQQDRVAPFLPTRASSAAASLGPSPALQAASAALQTAWILSR
jgi:hypothetical protein